jgi:NADH-quinone oxidoreductase subunit M
MMQLVAMMESLSGLLSLLGAPLTQQGTFPWLSVVTFAPLIGVLAIMLIPKQQEAAHRTVALVTTLIVFAMSIGPMVLFNPAALLAPGQPFTFQLAGAPCPGSRCWASAMRSGLTASASGS